STASPFGLLSCASTARPPSPEKPGREFPAIRVRLWLGSSLKTAFLLEKYTFPEWSVATPLGEIEALVAGTGVCGGAPPATVEIKYGCAPAALNNRKPETIRMHAVPTCSSFTVLASLHKSISFLMKDRKPGTNPGRNPKPAKPGKPGTV